MIYNKQLTSVLLTAWLLTSCNNIPNINISIGDNQTAEKATTTAKKEETPQKIKTEEKSTSEIEEISQSSTVNQNSKPKTIAQSSSGITPQQLNRRVKQFTVRIDGASNGSGVIVDQSDNTYTVLTNWHVVQEPQVYTIQTSDGREHQVNYQQVEQLSGVDLALVKFTSEQNYQTAKVGDSDYLSEGQGVHLAGYPGIKTNGDRIYRFYNLNIVSLLDTPINQGYSVLYEGETISGMSGSPLLDNNGHLVGIHGIYRIDDPQIRKGSSYAIPINTYQKLMAEKQESTDTVASQPSSISSKKDVKSVDNSKTVPQKQADNIIAHQENSTEANSGIQEGQFVHDGFENKLKVEIVKVKRIQNPETKKRDTVAVSFRVKRLVKEMSSAIFLNSQYAKARNIDTFEEYKTIRDKYTDSVQISVDLPLNVWGDAYFWLQVPEGIEVIDIVIPQTAIFKNVPIEG